MGGAAVEYPSCSMCGRAAPSFERFPNKEFVKVAQSQTARPFHYQFDSPPVRTERIDRVLEYVNAVKAGICVERARYFTQSYKRTEAFPQIVRRAKGLEHSLKNISLYVLPAVCFSAISPASQITRLFSQNSPLIFLRKKSSTRRRTIRRTVRPTSSRSMRNVFPSSRKSSLTGSRRRTRVGFTPGCPGKSSSLRTGSESLTS